MFSSTYWNRLILRKSPAKLLDQTLENTVNFKDLVLENIRSKYGGETHRRTYYFVHLYTR